MRKIKTNRQPQCHCQGVEGHERKFCFPSHPPVLLLRGRCCCCCPCPSTYPHCSALAVVRYLPRVWLFAALDSFRLRHGSYKLTRSLTLLRELTFETFGLLPIRAATRAHFFPCLASENQSETRPCLLVPGYYSASSPSHFSFGLSVITICFTFPIYCHLHHPNHLLPHLGRSYSSRITLLI